MKKVFRNVFTAAFLLLILIGCSTTKRIADDEVLYTGSKENGNHTRLRCENRRCSCIGRSIYSLRRNPTILCSLLISARRFP